MPDIDASPPRGTLVVSTLPDMRENLDGYALRLAERNGYARPVWLREILGMDAPARGRKVRLPLLSPAGLARLTGSPASDGFDRLFDAMGVPAPLPGFDVIQRMTRGRPWLCPRCIADDGIQLAIWELQFCVSCPRHRCRLVAACPVCGRPWRLDRGGIDLCDIQGCVGRPSCCDVVPVDGAETALSAWLHELWHPAYKEVARDVGVVRLAELFPSLDLPDALALIRFLGAAPAEVATVKPDDLMNAPLMAVANSCRFLADGVDGIRRFLLAVEGHRADRDHGSVHAVLGRHLKLLTDKSSLVSDRIRDLVLPLVGEVWDAECALRNAPVALSRGQDASRRWITQSDAVKRLGVSAGDIRGVADRASITVRVVNKRKQKVYLFDVDDVERAARELNFDGTAGKVRAIGVHVTCTKVAARLSTSPAVVTALCETGLIGRIPCRATHLYSMDDAERLVATLDRICDGEAASDHVLLPTAGRLMGIDLATAVRRAAGGELKLVVAYPERRGLGRYAVPRAELRRVGGAGGDVMSFNQCMSRLVCKRPLIDELVRTGHLTPASGRLWMGKSDTSLDARSVERFAARFVTGSDLARKGQVTYWAMKKILARHGLGPAFECAGGQEVYDRESAERVLGCP